MADSKTGKTPTGFWPIGRGDPNVKNPAPAGWDWQVVRNQAGVFVGWRLVRDPNELTGQTKPGGAGGGGGNAYYIYGGGGGGGAKGLSQYIQRYRIMFDDPSVNPPKSLLKQAEAGRWSGAYWDMMVRLKDPAYFKSAEAKRRLVELREYWKAVLPGTKVNKTFAKNYLRHGWTAAQLQQQIMRRPEAKKLYPNWKQYVAAQRRQGAAKSVNPLQYHAYAKTFEDVYRRAGLQPPRGYERLFFRSGISDEEFVKNYGTLASMRSAAVWDVGDVTEEQQKATLFNLAGAERVRSILQQAANKQQRFMQSGGSGYRLGEREGRIVMKGI